MAKILDNLFKSDDAIQDAYKASLELGLVIKRPTSYGSETVEIAELLKKGKIIAFSMENLSNEDAIRTCDYILGATDILGGKLEKITDKVYILIPSGIKVEETYFNNKQIVE